VRAATLRPDGTVQVRTLGSPCRPPGDVAALSRPDGPAIAFADNAANQYLGLIPAGGGRVHTIGTDDLLAAPSVSPAPTARAIVTPSRRLRYGQALKVRVVCDRACDVHAAVPSGLHAGDPRWRTLAEGGGAAPAGGEATLVLDPDSGTLVAPRRHGVPLTITACSPDGSAATTTSIVQPARQVPARPGPVPLDVHAHRAGGHIVVTWRIARPMHAITFSVFGDGADIADTVQVRVPGRLRTHFRVVLRPTRPAAIRKVEVFGFTNEPPAGGHRRTVKVSG
jgi:hypothetical protein